MEIRRRFSPPQEAGDVTAPVTMAPVLTISLSIPLPLAWPRHLRGIDHRLPADAALTCIELAFGESRAASAERRSRRVARRGARAISRREPAGPGSALPSFAVAMREGAWWQVALARLGQRTRRLHVVRLLSL